MTPLWPPSPWMLTVAIGLLLAGACAMLVAELRAHALATKVRSVLRHEAPPRRGARNLALLIVGGLRRLGEKLRDTAFFSRKDIAELERTVAACGLDAGPTASAVIGAKLLLFALLPAGIYALSIAREWSSEHQLIGTALAVPAALMLPNWSLDFLRRSYREALRRGLPDALDLMVVCAEAGLGFETTIERVAFEIRGSSRAVSLELAILEQELRVATDRREALTRLGQRSSLEGFRRLSGTLLQTLHYGTPLAQGLRTLSREMRQERLTAFEERAARLPALLVPPLILFIMPCLFIILLGPSVVQLMAVFGSL